MGKPDGGLAPPKEWSGPDFDADHPIGDLLLLEQKVIEVFKDFLFTEEDAPDEQRIMEFDHVMTAEEARVGRIPILGTTGLNQPGTRYRHWISCVKFVRVYYEILSDASIPYDREATEEEKKRDLIAYILLYDDMFKLGHGRFIRPWREEGKI